MVVGEWDESGGLDGLSDGALEALARDLMGSGVKQVSREGVKPRKIRRGAKWERLDGVGLNQTLVIEVELPGYFVAAMNQRGFSYREAVQEYLIKRGQTWWYPRFMAAMKAKQIEAYYRFTRSVDKG